MTSTQEDEKSVDHERGRTYEVDVEGDVHPWPRPTISVPDLRHLAGWSSDQEVVMVNLETNEEVTLAGDAVVELKPGHGFGKRVKFKRGEL